MNPFTTNIEALERERNTTSDELLDWKTKLAWFQGFNLDQENFNLRHTERLESETQAKLHQAQQAAIGPAAMVKQLELKSGMGFDPRHWFSSERAVAKRHLVVAQQELVAQQSRIAGMKIEISKAAELRRKIQREIATALTFDPLLAQSAIPALQATLDRIAPNLASLCQRRDDLDEVLREPLESLRAQKDELARLNKRIWRAEVLENDLKNAPNSYARRQIHEKCERELGDGNPGSVLWRARSALRGVEGTISKLQSRIDSFIRFASWDIRHIVIDGNNLCYEGNRFEAQCFIKLAALEALVPILALKYEVTLIFDASIRSMLALSDKNIAAKFPLAARVHIVASKTAADETVLSVAGADPHTFVLSNDQYKDFTDKMAVRDKRKLSHEIVAQVAYIHELRIAARFSIKQDAEAV